ncbi:MAG: cysteine--tRNA ligase [Phycisphaerae bacterium]|nr:cysteine--tRNA ligase [Phycisphaerae bacterium]
MTIRLYNTMTRRVEEFQPRNPPRVNLYTCGPTVYNYAHIGNLRTYVFEDVLVRALKLAGFDVKRVMNVTDVGHLVSDADEGEDKMEKGARREGKTIHEIARHYYDAFVADMHRLNLLPPEQWCWATDEIDAQKAQVEALAEKGFTYVIEDGIYFDTSKFPDYGRLAGQNLADLKAGARIEPAAGKKNPTDFAVWKFSPKGQQRLMEWDNPCGIPGKGFPGWHIECSAMAIKYLGEYLDIHCGGVDHVKVHHSNEIAQAEGALGHAWCRWWMHGEFLTMPKDDGGGKMSKSSGEFLTLEVLIRNLRDMGFTAEKDFNDSDAALSYRYFLLNAHYRQQLTFTWNGLAAAANAYRNLKAAVLNSKRQTDASKMQTLNSFMDAFREAVLDDLNMPRALAVMWSVANEKNNDGKYATLLEMDNVLGLGMKEMKTIPLPWREDEIRQDMKERDKARKARDFARADAIRDKYERENIKLVDQPNGFVSFDSTGGAVLHIYTPRQDEDRPPPGTASVDESKDADIPPC